MRTKSVLSVNTNPEESKEEIKEEIKEESKPLEIKKEKKPRKYSFIDAYSEWRKETKWTGLCPKKETSEYNEIRKLYDSKR